MSERMVACERCGRVRSEKVMKQGECIHGRYFICRAMASCKNVARLSRREERRAEV